MPKLTIRQLESAKPGRNASGAPIPRNYGDGDGLYFRVIPSGRKYWIQRATVNGKRRDMGLGPWPQVGLREARIRAFENRKLIYAGGDPVAEKRKAAIPTFREAAERTLQAIGANWRGGDTERRRWWGRLERYALPQLGALPVDSVRREQVLRVLLPIWNEKQATARNVRRSIKVVLAWAQSSGHVADNEAGEVLDGALPKRSASGSKANHAAMPAHEVPDALRRMDEGTASAALKLCFRWLILTAARSGEARGATWAEIDIPGRAWTIPAERMKAGREHRVPLSDAALQVLEQARTLGNGHGLLFPSPMNASKPLSARALGGALRKACETSATVHGFRSAFRTWAGEHTSADHATMEACLAHRAGTAVENAYIRGDFLAKRARLMERWAAYLAGKGADVIAFPGAA